MSTSGTGAREQLRRLLALVPYLQSRRSVSIREVAADFGVSEATLRRDLNVLWMCGLPGLGMGDLIEIDMEALEDEQVVRLSNADYLSRPLRLDSTEASALMVALRTLREASSEDERAIVDQVVSKIEAAAGEGAEVASSVQVHLPHGDENLSALRSELERAVADGRQVRLDYYVPARDESTQRVVDPLALASAEGQDYLDAWCHQADDQRLFRLDRISAAEVLDTPVDSHPDVAPRDLTSGIFQPAEDDVLAQLSLRPSARWVAEYYPVEQVSDEPDGSLTVALRVSDPAWLTRLMLRLGGEARLVGPSDLVDGVREAAARALRHYR